MINHNSPFFDFDALKVLLASGSSIGAMFTDADIILKVIIGFLTSIYISLKIFKLCRTKK